MMLRMVVGLVALLALNPGAYAEWGVGGGIGQSFPTGPRTFWNAEKEKLHGSLWLQKELHPGMGVELNVQSLGFASRNKNLSHDADVMGYTLNLFHRYQTSSRWTPIAALGAGLGDVVDYGLKGHKEFLGLIRYGVEYGITPQLGLGAHAQFTYLGKTSANSPSEMHALGYLVALTYRFGGSDHMVSRAKAETVAPVVAAAAPVVEDPSKMDSDGDGVVDSLDKCAGTPAGAKVNAYGCQLKEKAQMTLNLTFPSGKAMLAGDQDGQIESVAKFMKENPQTKVLIEGHSDKTGNEAANVRLSQARANAVRNELIKRFGISTSRLTAKGFGSAQPIAPNDTAEGRQKNRRVIATISE